MKHISLAILFLIILLPAFGQKSDLYLSRYLPGGEQISDAEVTLFNATSEPMGLGGFAIVTRYWRVTLPDAITIPPYSSLTFSSNASDGTLFLGNFPGYRTRKKIIEEPGDFVALFQGATGSFLDGLYLAAQPEVAFLPMDFGNGSGESISLPAETHPRWAFLQVIPDPIMAYDRNNGAWQANARDRNLFPATHYLYLQGRNSEEGGVMLKWKTEFETNCLFHRIERSSDGETFTEIGRLPGQELSNELRDYQFTDRSTDSGRVYFYRIRHIDRAGKPEMSEPVRVSTSAASGFQFDVFREGPDTGQYLRIRYSAKTQQVVSLKLLDEQLRQIEVLSTGNIEPNREYLVTYRKSLARGVYYLMVETDDERYHEVVVIQ